MLILDALSLRELPWLLQGAKERGFTLHAVTATASELPSETNPFARALGLASRSQLQANGGGLAHKLQPAQTETIDLPWKDCTALVGNASGAKNWVFWHHWPDAKLHDYGAGQGLELLTKDAAQQLTSADFWGFVEHLATGRRLVITSDHGYAATGYFPDADGEVAAHLKQTFSSGRSKAGNGDVGPFVPPGSLLALVLVGLVASVHPQALPVALPLLLAWTFAPALMAWLGRPPAASVAELSVTQRAFLGRLARQVMRRHGAWRSKCASSAARRGVSTTAAT